MSKEKAYKILEQHIERHGFDYPDNYRCYKDTDYEGMGEYEEAFAFGCCGFYDTEVTIDGDKWHIGCNYGH